MTTAVDVVRRPWVREPRGLMGLLRNRGRTLSGSPATNCAGPGLPDRDLPDSRHGPCASSPAAPWAKLRSAPGTLHRCAGPSSSCSPPARRRHPLPHRLLRRVRRALQVHGQFFDLRRLRGERRRLRPQGQRAVLHLRHAPRRRDASLHVPRRHRRHVSRRSLLRPLDRREVRIGRHGGQFGSHPHLQGPHGSRGLSGDARRRRSHRGHDIDQRRRVARRDRRGPSP